MRPDWRPTTSQFEIRYGNQRRDRSRTRVASVKWLKALPGGLTRDTAMD